MHWLDHHDDSQHINSLLPIPYKVSLNLVLSSHFLFLFDLYLLTNSGRPGRLLRRYLLVERDVSFDSCGAWCLVRAALTGDSGLLRLEMLFSSLGGMIPPVFGIYYFSAASCIGFLIGKEKEKSLFRGLCGYRSIAVAGINLVNYFFAFCVLNITHFHKTILIIWD